MNNLYNIYCDESCHLEHDRQKAMVLGGIWCPYDKRKKKKKLLVKSGQLRYSITLTQNMK